MNEILISRVDVLLQHIALVERDLSGKTLEDFKKSDLLVRATCFSVVQVAEHLNRLSKELKDDYPNIPWDKAVGMRNLIVHVYNRVKAEVVYNTAVKDLPALKKEFEQIKDDLSKKAQA